MVYLYNNILQNKINSNSTTSKFPITTTTMPWKHTLSKTPILSMSIFWFFSAKSPLVRHASGFLPWEFLSLLSFGGGGERIPKTPPKTNSSPLNLDMVGLWNFLKEIGPQFSGEFLLVFGGVWKKNDVRSPMDLRISQEKNTVVITVSVEFSVLDILLDQFIFLS